MEIPALTDAIQEVGEKLEIPEIRVWCHPPRIGKSGDDYYHTFPGFAEALNFIKEHQEEAEAAPLIAFRGYELNIFAIKAKEE